MSYIFTVPDKGLKLASFLKEALPKQFSAKFIKKTIEKGCCRVNKRVINYSNHNLNKDDVIEIAIKQQESDSPEVLFEDSDFMVIYKPAGFLCDEKALKFFFSYPLYLVHRLDKETSGLLIIVKNPQLKGEFDNLFKNRLITKRYLALCDGLVANSSGTIEVPLESTKKNHHALVVKVSSEGTMSKTLWKKLGMGLNASFIEFDIITGKTHQIRAHATHFGHPILGDPVYLKRPVCSLLPGSLCLHAYYIKFVHPVTQKVIEIYANPPAHFMDALKKLIPHAKLPRY